MINDRRGVYFLANDRVIDFALAFLNSFRAQNPTIALCLIPFRDDISLLLKYQERFNFFVFDDRETLERCDTISRRFHPNTMGHYRKLAMWQGPFNEFVYIDIDMVVLKNIDFGFRLLQHYSFIVSFSNLPSLMQWVWKPSVFKTDLLDPDQIRYSANTGFIISSKHAFKAQDILVTIEEAEKLKSHMVLACMEQPLLNYLIVTSGQKHTSLYNLMDTGFYPENYTEFWAGNPAGSLKPGYKTTLLGKSRDIFLVHWAGTWQLKKWEIKLFGLLYLLRLKRHIWSMSLLMPLRKTWRYYRYM